MTTRSPLFPPGTLHFAVWIAAMFASLSCGESTAPPQPARYLVTLNRSNPVAGDFIIIKAQIVDADNQPLNLSGRTVNWIYNGRGLQFSEPSTLTGPDGSTLVLFTTDPVAGHVYAFTAFDLGGIQGTSDAVTTVAGPPARYIVTPDNPNPVVGSAVLISAQLTDQHSNSTKVAGRFVNWSSTINGPGTGSFSSPTSTTDANGIATVSFTIGTNSLASYIVMAVDNHNAGGSSVSLIPRGAAATKYAVTASVLDPPAGADVLITAQAMDAYNNPSPAGGLVIDWSKTGAGGVLLASSGTTNDDGTATVALTTAAVAGTSYVVTARDAAGNSGSSPTVTTQKQVSLASISTGLGAMNSCGIATDGMAWCWGANDNSQIGNASRADRSVAGQVSGSYNMTSLSSGLSHTCGVSSGRVLCWGSNASGQLGDNTTLFRDTPVQINSSLTFISVSAGAAHTCALASTGDVFCWGSDDSGRLGDGGAASNSPSPVKVSGGLTFSAVSAGVDHTCGITTSGDAYCWGSNAYGKLGDNSFVSRMAPSPVVAGGLKFISISVAESHTCGLTTTGLAYCWGDDGFGQLGDGTPRAPKSVPAAVAGGITFIAISSRGLHSCGIAQDGSGWCWGDNSSGELGNPLFNAAFSTSPTAVAGGLSFKSISVGGGLIPGGGDYYYYYDSQPVGHSCGVTTGGTAYCWGSSNRGELGGGPLNAAGPNPTKVSGQP